MCQRTFTWAVQVRLPSQVLLPAGNIALMPALFVTFANLEPAHISQQTQGHQCITCPNNSRPQPLVTDMKNVDLNAVHAQHTVLPAQSCAKHTTHKCARQQPKDKRTLGCKTKASPGQVHPPDTVIMLQEWQVPAHLLPHILCIGTCIRVKAPHTQEGEGSQRAELQHVGP